MAGRIHSTRARQVGVKSATAAVEAWNGRNPVGTPVVLTRDNGERIQTVTTSEAYVLSGHTAVVHLARVSGCYLLSRVTPATADVVTAEICDRCHATLGTYGEACTAPLDERCPEFEAVERIRSFAKVKAEGRA